MEVTKEFYDSIRALVKDHEIPLLIPTNIPGVDTILNGGFKRGELMTFWAPPSPIHEHKSNLVFNMILRRMQEDPTFKPVFTMSLEHDAEYFSEERFQESLKAMGLEYTYPSDQKEQKQ